MRRAHFHKKVTYIKLLRIYVPTQSKCLVKTVHLAEQNTWYTLNFAKTCPVFAIHIPQKHLFSSRKKILDTHYPFICNYSVKKHSVN